MKITVLLLLPLLISSLTSLLAEPLDDVTAGAPPEKETDAVPVTEQQLADFLAETYNPARNYLPGWLTDHVRLGQRLKRAFPEQASAIEDALQPFARELDHHRRGDRKFEGRWFTPSEWNRFEQEREVQLWQKFFQQGPIYELSNTVIPADTAMILLAVAAASVIALVTMGIHCALSLRTGWTWSSLLGLLFSVTVLAIYGWFIYQAVQPPPLLLSLEKPSTHQLEDNPVRQLLYHSVRDPHDGAPPSPAYIAVTPEDVDAFFAAHVRLTSPDKDSFFRFKREQIRITSDGMDWIIFDSGTWLGLPMVFTYRVTFLGGTYQVGGQLGSARLPARGVESSWRALETFARKLAKDSRINETYTPARFSPHSIDFRHTAK